MRERFEKENIQIKEMVNTIEQKIISTMKSSGKRLWNLGSEENKDFDRIYTYDYGGWDNALRELRVIGFHLLENGEHLAIISVPLEYPFEQTWTDEELLKIIEEESECFMDGKPCYDYLFGGELLGYFTALNIAEVIDEYYL